MWSGFLLGSDAVKSVSSTHLELVPDGETKVLWHWLQIVLKGHAQSGRLPLALKNPLKRLSIKDSTAWNEMSQVDLPCLQKLVLQDCGQLLRVEINCPELRELEITGCWRLSKAKVEDFIKKTPLLIKVTLDDVGWDLNQVKRFNFEKLKELSIPVTGENRQNTTKALLQIHEKYPRLKKLQLQGRGLLDHTLKGHSAEVFCVTSLANGQVVSGSRDKMLKVWDIRTGDCVQTLKGHSGGVSCVTSLANGQVVSGSEDKTLKVWDIRTGDCVRTLRGHSAEVLCVTSLANGQVVSGSSDKMLKIWDTRTGNCVQTLKGRGGIRCVTSLANGQVVSGSHDYTLKVWDIRTGDCVQTLMGHSGGVNCVTSLANGQVVSGSWDKTLKVWDIRTGDCVQTLKGHSEGVWCVTSLANGQVVSGSEDSTLKVWDIRTGNCVQTLKVHNRGVHCVTSLANGQVVSGSRDKTLKVWSLASLELLPATWKLIDSLLIRENILRVESRNRETLANLAVLANFFPGLEVEYTDTQGFTMVCHAPKAAAGWLSVVLGTAEVGASNLTCLHLEQNNFSCKTLWSVLRAVPELRVLHIEDERLQAAEFLSLNLPWLESFDIRPGSEEAGSIEVFVQGLKQRFPLLGRLKVQLHKQSVEYDFASLNPRQAEVFNELFVTPGEFRLQIRYHLLGFFGERDRRSLACANQTMREEMLVFNRTTKDKISFLTPRPAFFKQKTAAIHNNSSAVDSLLSCFAGKEESIALTQEIHITRGEVHDAIKDANRYYSADFINLLLHGCNQDLSLKIYPAITINLLSQYHASAINQQEDFAFVPLNVAYDQNFPEHKNHWAALIISKQHQCIFYLDPAQKEYSVEIRQLQDALGYEKVIENPVDLQQKEKDEGWIRHCGAYTVEIFRALLKAIRKSKVAPDKLTVQTILSAIACGKADNMEYIRRNHIREARESLRSHIENTVETRNTNT